MSSRAVRKALKQRELEEAEAKLASLGTAATEGHDEDDDEGSHDETPSTIPRGKPNPFAMLGGNDDGEDAEEVDNEDEDEDEDKEKDREADKNKEDIVSDAPAPTETDIKKPKKKKRKGKKGKGAANAEDEIDIALRLLNLNPASTGSASSRYRQHDVNSDHDLIALFRIDTKNLDASQEMRRLFGRAAMNDASDDAGGAGGGGGGGGGGGRGRQGRRIQRAVQIPGATPGGRGLLLKRNVFVQPKPTWPNVGSGGLAMAHCVPDEYGSGDSSEYRYQHGALYQNVQRQFMMCVMSMDPNRILSLLEYNPYHISTLLQTSEIFSHQRDYTVSGELLERALFSFGRSTHSAFQTLLTSSTAPSKHPYLSFRYFPNREFFLTIWRYLQNLSMRGTWRTAAEFGRLLWSLSYPRDPYAMVLYLDYLLLKAHQPHLVLSLATSPYLARNVAHLPNIAYSISLAYHQLGKDPVALEYLAKAVYKFPWIATRLWQALDLGPEKLPSVLWGRIPPDTSPLQQILCELYVERARDLWMPPEASRLLVQTAAMVNSLPRAPQIKSPVGWATDDDVIDGVPASVARHVVLADIPGVTTSLPIGWKNRVTSTYDPLPPRDATEDYDMLSGVTGVSAQPRAPRLNPVVAGGGGIGGGAEDGRATRPVPNYLALYNTLLSLGHFRDGNNDADADASPPDWGVVEEVVGTDNAQMLRAIIEQNPTTAADDDGLTGRPATPPVRSPDDQETFLRQVAMLMADEDADEEAAE